MMDSFGIDLDKVLDEFEESEDNQTSYGNRFGGPVSSSLYEPADLDLSDADFAPICSSATEKLQKSDFPVVDISAKTNIITVEHDEEHINHIQESHHVNGSLSSSRTDPSCPTADENAEYMDTSNNSVNSAVNMSHSIRQTLVDESTTYAEQRIMQLVEEENASFSNGSIIEAVNPHPTSEQLICDSEIGTAQPYTESNISSDYNDNRNEIGRGTVDHALETPAIICEKTDDNSTSHVTCEINGKSMLECQAVVTSDNLESEIILNETEKTEINDKDEVEKMDVEYALVNDQRLNETAVENIGDRIEAEDEGEMRHDGRIKSEVSDEVVEVRQVEMSMSKTDNEGEVRHYEGIKCEAGNEGEVRHDEGIKSDAGNEGEVRHDKGIKSETGNEGEVRHDEGIESETGNEGEVRHDERFKSETGNEEEVRHDEGIKSETGNEGEVRHEEGIKSETGNEGEVKLDERIECDTGNEGEVRHDEEIGSEAGNEAEVRHEEGIESEAGNEAEVRHDGGIESEAGNEADLRLDEGIEIEAGNEAEVRKEEGIKSEVMDSLVVHSVVTVPHEGRTDDVESREENAINSDAQHSNLEILANQELDKQSISNVVGDNGVVESVDNVSSNTESTNQNATDIDNELQVESETIGAVSDIASSETEMCVKASASQNEMSCFAIDQVQLTERLLAKKQLLVSDSDCEECINLPADCVSETTNAIDGFSDPSDAYDDERLCISPAPHLATTIVEESSIKVESNEENCLTLNDRKYDEIKHHETADSIADIKPQSLENISSVKSNGAVLDASASVEDYKATDAVSEQSVEMVSSVCDSKLEFPQEFDQEDQNYSYSSGFADENSIHDQVTNEAEVGIDTAENFGENFYKEMMTGSVACDQELLFHSSNEGINDPEYSIDDEALNEDHDDLIQSIVNSTIGGLDFVSSEVPDLPPKSEETRPIEAGRKDGLHVNRLPTDSLENVSMQDTGVTLSGESTESRVQVSENMGGHSLPLDDTAALENISRDDALYSQSNSLVEGIDRTPPSMSHGPDDVVGGARTGEVVGGARAKVPTVSSNVGVPDDGEWQGITTALQAAEAAALQQPEHSSNSPTTVTDDAQQIDAAAVLPQPPGPPLCANMNVVITQLGKISPVWLPDSEASNCMECQVPFSFTKRRHHCRACGKIFCSSCCNLKVSLEYMEKKEGRVCSKCYQDFIRAQCYERIHPQASENSSVVRPNPNNPEEYCSMIPPSLQVAQAEATPPLSVMVPTGVLRKQGSVRQNEPKQVMFSDGIRPGGDLTELDGPSEPRVPVQSSSRRTKRVDKSGRNSTKTKTVRETAKTVNFLPADGGLPPIMTSLQDKDSNSPSQDYAMELIKSSDYRNPVIFALNHNLVVMVTIVDLACCVSRRCWCFTTRGMCTVSQDEIVILLECLPDESSLPVDIMRHLCSLYDEAAQGNVINNLGFSLLPPNTLGNTEHSGFLFVRQTFQCLLNIIIPEPPYLFGILLQKWEIPWAKTFPLRLMLRLGAEFRYYPCPLVSVRGRQPVYGEIGHTIMNLLVDFHNYQYTLPVVPGLVIHMEDERTTVTLPRNSYDPITKVLSSSDEHVMAFGAAFSQIADSHLVCLQSEDGNYQTQAINIQNRPRKVTGACFIVFNGALKSSSGLSAKSSIIEDGIMVQISSESMAALKQSLRGMKNYTIDCGSIGQDRPSEIVSIEWSDNPIKSNVGVRSPVDGVLLEDLPSMRINAATDYAGEGYTIRWTELFFMKNDEEMAEGSRAGGGRGFTDQPDVTRLADSIAQACSLALTSHLPLLTFESLTRIGLRVSISSEQVGYEVGSLGSRLPDVCMNDLDEKLIPVIHGAASPGRPDLVLELIFHILQHKALDQPGSAAATDTATASAGSSAAKASSNVK